MPSAAPNDRSFLDGASVTPGHEAAGTVVAAGPGTRTPVGTTGAVYLMDFCGECRSCRLGLGRHLKVLITDVIPYRLELAKRLGGLPVNVANIALNAGIKSRDLVSVDMAVDTSGKQIARQEAVNSIAQPGSLIT